MIGSTVFADNGAKFRCLVTNAFGNATSNEATLTVNAPPNIATQPSDLTVMQGQSATFMVAATGRTPRPIVDKLAADINKALKEPDSMERWKSLGFDPIGSTPEVFAERQKADLAYWKRMIDYTGIKVE